MIKNIGDLEYLYIYEMDNIKRAYYSYIKCKRLLNECDILTFSEKRRLQSFHKDFKLICKKLIKRERISNIEDYLNCLRTLIIINAKARKILKNNLRYKYKKREYRKLYKLEYSYNKTNEYLPMFDSSIQTFFKNHSTIMHLIEVSVLFAIILIFSCLANFLFGILISIFLPVIIYFVVFIFTSKGKNLLMQDSINRTIRSKTYISSENMKAFRKELKGILKLIDKNNN